jgi:hypothetical protein
MWTFLAVCLLALILGLVVKDKTLSIGKFQLSLPQVLIAGVGLSYIVAVVVAVIYASIRLQGFYNTPLIGVSYIQLEADAGTGVESNLQLGYWLACAVGPILLLLGLLRPIIIGTHKTSDKPALAA